MAGRTCHNCVYCCDDPCLWLDLLWLGEQLLPRCANHPQWPGQLHEVPGVPCRNYRPRVALPEGDNVRMIPLADGGYAYVDAADYEWLNQWSWYLHDGYAARFEKGKTIFMHRQIMQPPEGMVVDHIDDNKVNNCRVNLRVCTHAQNMRNTRKHYGSLSRFKGLIYRKKTRKWYARYQYQGKRRLVGPFETEVEAARAYDRLAVEWFGEYARLNFPREWPPERRAQVHAQRQETDEQTSKTKKVRRSEGKKGRGKKTTARAGTQGRRGRERTTKSARTTAAKSTRKGKTKNQTAATRGSLTITNRK